MIEKKRKPSIRFKGFIDDWEQRKFSEIFIYLQNNSLSRADLNYEQGLVKNIHYGDVLIKFGEILDVEKAKIPFISNIEFNVNHASLLQNGDLVIADAAEDETVGKCSEIKGIDGISIVSGLHTIPCRPSKTFAAGYLGYYMNSSAYHDQLLPLIQGTKISSISKSALQNTDIIYPDSEKEQLQIGQFFQNLDNLISLNQRKYGKLINIKKAMIEKMFPKDGSKVPEIRFKGFTDEWQPRKLGELVKYVVDNRGKNPKYYCENGIPIIDNFMIKNNCYPNLKEATRFIDEDLFNNFIRKYNEVDDTLITLVGNGIGNIALFPKQKSVIIQNTLGLRFDENKKFMYYSMLSKNKEIVSLDRGMAQPSIRQDELLNLEFLIPNDKEQNKISELMFNIDNLIMLHQQELDKLKNIKKACFQRMFL